MTFDEFENTLQEWLDEDRLDEVESLIPLVCQTDQARCEELLRTYQALFTGLAIGSSFHHIDLPTPVVEPTIARPASRRSLQRTSVVVALAACLAIVAIAPGWFSGGQNGNMAQVTPVEPPDLAPIATKTVESVLVSPDAGVEIPLERNFVYLSTYSIEPLARTMASQTDSAFRSLGEVSRNLNPMDQQLDVYRDAAPLLETLTAGLLPGSRSLSNAFSLLQESADGTLPRATPAATEPTTTVAPEESAVG